MPGIVGFLDTKLRPQHQRLDSMLGCMLHEKFYTSGTMVDEQLGVAVGWTCHEGSFSDCMPVWNEKRDVCLIFAGEEYSEEEAIQALRSRGHAFVAGNASYLVHQYEEKGIRFLEQLNGHFSGVLVDLREKRIVLFNDRFGIGRIYIHENEQGFFFSSEAKSLLKVLPHLRELNLQGLGEFLSCGCVLQNRTLFSGISLLPGGSAWTFYPGQTVKKETYFRIEDWEKQPQLDASSYYQKVEETWKRILPRYFRGSNRVALSLTGGVDSRMILAWAPCSAGELPCYTFGGQYRDCADVKISREVARICQQDHETISVGREFLAQFPILAERNVYISDGSLDVTGSIDLYVQAIARQLAPVRVTGTAGGEILRRLVVFKPDSMGQELLGPELTSLTKTAAMTYAQEIQGHRLSFTAFKQVPWHMASKFAVEQSQITLRMPYFDNDLVALVYQSPPEVVASGDLSLWLCAEGNPSLSRIRTDRGVAFHSIPVISQIAHMFQEFTFRAEYAYDYGMPQWLARLDHTLARARLERLFLGRHKFAHFRTWYRDELSQYVKDILLDPRTLGRPYLHRTSLEQMVESHVGGYQNHTLEIHKMLTIELIQRHLIELN